MSTSRARFVYLQRDARQWKPTHGWNDWNERVPISTRTVRLNSGEVAGNVPNAMLGSHSPKYYARNLNYDTSDCEHLHSKGSGRASALRDELGHGTDEE